METPTFFIHSTAVIDEGANVGMGTSIGHYSHLMRGCKVGEYCRIGQNVFIDTFTVIGNRVNICDNVSIYNGVIIEDDVLLGPSVVFTNTINPRSFIIRKHEFRKTLILKGVSVGANATVICGVEIGRYAFVEAGAIVTKNILPYAVVTGNPARQSGWISKAGMKLDFDAKGLAICNQTGENYKLKQGFVRPVK